MTAAAGLLGVQTPRIRSVPRAATTEAGTETIELAASVGLDLLPWQRSALRDGMGEQADGRWSAFEVGLVCSRQNGKNVILEARELYGMFLAGERLILHSAHKFDAASEAFQRIRFWIDNSDDLRSRVRKMSEAHGQEGIELYGPAGARRTGGSRLKFMARSSTTGSGRAFTGDTVVLDESFNLTAEAMAAMLPTLGARPNPQVWYSSSAGLSNSHALAKIRRRGLSGTARRLAYLEWSATPDDDKADPRIWASANPSLGYLIDPQFLADELEALGPEKFGREHLGIGDWPTEAGESWQVFARELWESLEDGDSAPEDPVSFAIDSPPNLASTTIAVVGGREDGRAHGEIIDRRPGTDWVLPRLVELAERWEPCAVVVAPSSPASSLIPVLEAGSMDRGRELLRDRLIKPGPQQEAAAYAAFYHAVTGDRFRYRTRFAEFGVALHAAVGGGIPRPVGDGGQAWGRLRTTVDISPVVALTLAYLGWMSKHEDDVPTPFALWG